MMRAHGPGTILLALLSIALLAGCGIAPPSPLGDDPEVVKAALAAKAGRPLPRLAVATVEVAYPLAFDLSVEPGRMPASVDRRALTDAIAADVEAFTGFGKPVVLDDEPPPSAGAAEGSLAPAEGVARARMSRDRLCAEAALKGAELLLLPKLTKAEVYFDKRNGSWIWNVMLWLYLWIPAWFVHDEDFGAQATLELTLVSVASERIVHRTEVSGRHVESLDDFDRGWDFFGIFRFPTSITTDQLRDVEETLLPHALRDLERKVVLALADEWPRTLADPERREAIERADASVVAVLVGVGKYQDDARIAGPPGASNDVAEAEALLKETLDVPAKNILRLEGRAATRYRIVSEGLEGLIRRRARPQDTVLVWFSGVGTTAPAPGATSGTAEPYLLPHDVKLDDLAGTAIALSAIGRALRASPARRAIVVLDAAFGPAAGGTRSLRGAASAAAPPPLAAFSEATRGSLDKEVILITATGGGEEEGRGEDAVDLAEARRGLLSYLLCEGARGRADADASGAVSVQELASYVARHVRAQAGLEGVLEAPALFRAGARVPTEAASGGVSWLPRAQDVKGL